MADPRITRRRLLAAGAGGVVVVGGGVAATQRSAVRRVYDDVAGTCGPDGERPPRSDARVVRGRLRSRAGYVLAMPAGGRAPRGVLVFLHGRGGTAADAIDALHLQDVAAAQRLGLVVAAVDGGDASYWHRRADGRDPIAALVDGLLPLVEREAGKLPTAVMGVSMGGYGAALAARQRPDLFRACVVSSGAMWLSAADQRSAVPDAFDDAEDFARNDVITRPPRVPVRVDCGTSDPFVAADRAFARAVRASPATFPEGCHDRGFWSRMAPAQLAWAAERLGST